MSANNGSLNIIQIFMMLALMNGLVNHVVINPMLLDASGRDAPVAVIATGVLFLLWIPLIGWLMKRSSQQKWMSWISDQTHPILAWVLIIPMLLILYFIGGTTVIHTIKWNLSNYLPTSSDFVLVLILVLLCSILVLWGINVIAITSGILLPLVSGLGIFVAASNTSMKDYHLLQPLLEYGLSPVAEGMLYAGGGFVEFIVILLLQHHLNHKVRLWQLYAFGLFTIMITLGPIIGAITEFGPVEASKQMASPFEQWRLVRIGQYIDHLDFLSIFQWLSGACIRVSLPVYILCEVIPFKKKSARNWFIVAVMSTYGAGALFPLNEYSFYLWMFYNFVPLSLITLLSLSILWAFISMINKRKRGKNHVKPAVE
ncbi:endospore germination permease [Neobacillus mesonae]|nr:endospore germination permease [Neobacillus mesonae]